MKVISSKRVSDSFSQNPKSAIQNRKLVGIVVLVLAFAMGEAVATAQQPKKIPRIGYLSAQDPARESARSEAIRRALREFGYIDGQNIAFRVPICGRKGRSCP